MAAVINTTTERPRGSAGRRSGLMGERPSSRPALRVVAGGRTAGDPVIARPRPTTDRAGRPQPTSDLPAKTSASRRLPAAVYWRRRMVAGFVAVVVLTVVWLAGVGAAAVASGAPEPMPDGAGAVVDGAGPDGPVHVVRPGDTLWSIAAEIDRGGDIRSVVAELADRTGGAALQPGQRIRLDGLAD